MNFNQFNKSISLNQNLANYTWFNVGGNAEILFIPNDIKELFDFLKSRSEKYEIFTIGAGSNILIRDKGISGITLITKNLKKISIDNLGIITAEAGAIDADVARFARDNERTGLEFLLGIPGTIGGGIRMNSGAFGSEFKDVLIDVKAINNLGEIKTFTHKDLQMGYRKIELGREWIFCEARFKTLKDTKENISTKMKNIIRLRKEAQPIAVKTGGSTFKNPPNQKAWKLIDEAGCRGLQNGDAMISQKHCNFIINLKKSTSQQIEELAKIVQEKVFKKSGIQLDWEIQRVGIK
jgi:UDP-N-acetylmuramate dehydrogenase